MKLSEKISAEETEEIALIRIIDSDKLIFKKIEFWWGESGISNRRGMKYLESPVSEFDVYKKPGFWLVLKRGKK